MSRKALQGANRCKLGAIQAYSVDPWQGLVMGVALLLASSMQLGGAPHFGSTDC